MQIPKEGVVWKHYETDAVALHFETDYEPIKDKWFLSMAQWLITFFEVLVDSYSFLTLLKGRKEDIQ